MMNGLWRVRTAVAGALILTTGPAAWGQWIEREHSLQAGWNAVYLEVDPAPERADLLFSGHPIEEVWARTLHIEIQGPPACQDPNDPNCVPPVASEWDTWLPPSHPARLVTNLHSIRGGRVYLIRASQPFALTVTGTPNGSVARWKTGYTLSGLHVEDNVNSAPTFGQYLAGSSAFSATSIYEVLGDGSLSQIANPANVKIRPGIGYWIRSAADTEYDGPVSVDKGSLRGIDFGSNSVEHQLRLTNRTPAARTVEVSYVASASVPGVPNGLPAHAGDVPLSWLQYVAGPSETALQWHALSTATWNLAGAASPAARAAIRLALERTGLSAAVIDSSGQGSQYQGLLLVRDGAGWRRWVPVVGQVPDTVGALANASGGGGRPGLYSGQVTVNQVQWVSAGARVWSNQDATDPTFSLNRRCAGGGNHGQACSDDAQCTGGACEGFCIGGANANGVCGATADCPGGRCSAETDNVSLRPAPAEFTFPVLVHLAADGVYTLLTEVTLLWQPPDDVAQTPGRFVLATPACPPAVCDALQAASLQDGEPFARRLGSAAFSFDGDLPLSGDFGSVLSGGYTIPANHPLSPFRHKYHPDHDCDQVGECFDVTRAFALTFATTPPPGETRPGWGDHLLGGTYEETITGLHKHSISVGGRFEMTRVSGVAVLNAQ